MTCSKEVAMPATREKEVQQRKTDQIQIRISPEDKAMIEQAAKLETKTAATWLRDLGVARAKRKLGR